MTDRANQVSLQAQQVKAGATDIKCNINAGGDNYFEWSIQASSSAYTAALAAGSFKNANDFQQALLSFFRTKLNALYPGQISSVTFVSQQSSSNGYTLTFRVYFNAKISLESKRTEIVSNIQSVYYNVLSSYFKSSSSSMSIPTSVKIEVPPAVSVTSKKAVLVPASENSRPISSGVLLNVTKVTESEFSKEECSFAFCMRFFFECYE